ncbi:hypothetical protein DNTS_028905 [Danionella cerebrum]|uniref:Transmembrane protein TMEM132 cohesin-like domain-containing protein n=1 Tax=Danionella cerebrum TaxID=2873325 RepID=A0A553N4X6_9TELE|nr:hypothetical protein DNTS_028905 [Danionella translucida]
MQSIPSDVSNRVKLKDGVVFLGARASNPVQWTVSQDVRSEGHRVVTLHCRRKDANFGKRTLVKCPDIYTVAVLALCQKRQPSDQAGFSDSPLYCLQALGWQSSYQPWYFSAR